MQLTLATLVVASILAFLNHPYIDAVYVEGVQKEIVPRDMSELLKQYINNASRGGNDMYPLTNFLI